MKMDNAFDFLEFQKQKVINDGFRAMQQGISLSDCPEILHKNDWEQGWRNAYRLSFCTKESAECRTINL